VTDSHQPDARPLESPVERVAGISAQRFLQDYYAANEPVVLEGFLDSWPCLGKWSPTHFADRYGDAVIEIMAGLNDNPDYQRGPAESRRTLRMRDFVAWVEGDSGSGDSYLVAQNQVLRQPALAGLWEDLVFPADFLDAAARAHCVSLWFGPANTVTPLHYDLQNALLAQVYGRKLVILISPVETPRVYNSRGGYSEVDAERPDYDRFPLFRHVVARKVDLAAGDALFLPFGWWHKVRSMSVSISLSCSNFVWPNRFP
jgi:hypothetical protein